MKILVFCEQRKGKLKPSALEALAAASQCTSSQQISAVILGHHIDHLAQELSTAGASMIHTMDHASLELYHGQHYAQAMDVAIQTLKPDMVLGVASAMGRDLFPQLAARHKGSLITDVIAWEQKDSVCIGGLKPMYAGKVHAHVRFQGTGLKLVTVRPNSFTPKPSSSCVADVSHLTAPVFSSSRLQSLEVISGKSTKLDLTEAQRVISGGRALGSAEKFSVLFECAEALGASVGASRAAVDAGYASHDMQVGQTGKTVTPNLYIACGLSGSIQHMAGMRTSKVIVAINTDPEAPIHSIADYGMVADLFEAVPLLTKKLKALD